MQIYANKNCFKLFSDYNHTIIYRDTRLAIAKAKLSDIKTLVVIGVFSKKDKTEIGRVIDQGSPSREAWHRAESHKWIILPREEETSDGQGNIEVLQRGGRLKEGATWEEGYTTS